MCSRISKRSARIVRLQDKLVMHCWQKTDGLGNWTASPCRYRTHWGTGESSSRMAISVVRRCFFRYSLAEGKECYQACGHKSFAEPISSAFPTDDTQDSPYSSPNSPPAIQAHSGIGGHTSSTIRNITACVRACVVIISDCGTKHQIPV